MCIWKQIGVYTGEDKIFWSRILKISELKISKRFLFSDIILQKQCKTRYKKILTPKIAKVLKNGKSFCADTLGADFVK